MEPVAIDNSINWPFTIEWLAASIALISLVCLLVILWQIWKEAHR